MPLFTESGKIKSLSPHHRVYFFLIYQVLSAPSWLVYKPNHSGYSREKLSQFGSRIIEAGKMPEIAAVFQSSDPKQGSIKTQDPTIDITNNKHNNQRLPDIACYQECIVPSGSI